MPGGSVLRICVDFGVNFVGDIHGVAVRLAVDVEQHRRLSIGGDKRVNRLHPGSTLATSPMRTGIPAGVVLTTYAAICSGVRTCPLIRPSTSW